MGIEKAHQGIGWHQGIPQIVVTLEFTGEHDIRKTIRRDSERAAGIGQQQVDVLQCDIGIEDKLPSLIRLKVSGGVRDGRVDSQASSISYIRDVVGPLGGPGPFETDHIDRCDGYPINRHVAPDSYRIERAAIEKSKLRRGRNGVICKWRHALKRRKLVCVRQISHEIHPLIGID